MKRRRLLQALAAAALIRPGHPARAERPVAPQAVGYLPWWMAAGWQSMALDKLDRVLLFDAPIGQDGNLLVREWPRSAPGLTGFAEAAGVALDLTLTLLKEGEFDRVFGDRAVRGKLLASCLRALKQPHISGLQLDIEGYVPAAANAVAGFHEWLLRLDDARRLAGKGLSAFFPASDSFSVYGAVGAARLDYWVAQLYDAHWISSKFTGPLVTRGESNPVAVPRALARLTALGVPRELVLFSVPLYGWQWPSESAQPGAATSGTAKLLTFAETPSALMPENRLVATELAKIHGLRRDREHSPYYAYRDGAQWIQGWYEDLPSLTRKFAPERAGRYAGLAFFPLGYDKGEIVEAMLRWWRSP